MNQLFVEAKPFSRKWPNYLTEDELRKFQNYLLETPAAGEIIKGAGGIRKVRWNVAGGGKRGGLLSRAMVIFHFSRGGAKVIFHPRGQSYLPV